MNIIQSCFVGFFKFIKLSCNKTINFLHEKVLNNFTIKQVQPRIHLTLAFLTLIVFFETLL